MAGYSDIVKSTQTGTKAGYKPKLYFMRVADVETWQRPTVPGVAAGDTVKITTAHVLADGKTLHAWDLKQYSPKITSDAIGDPGAQSLIHTLVCTVTGDNPATLEMVNMMLNDDLVFFVKDADCIGNGVYSQLGDDCNPGVVSPKFDSKQNDPTGGQKEYSFEIKTTARYFYTAATLPAPEA